MVKVKRNIEDCILVSRANAVSMLGGMVGMRKGPFTRVGMMLMKSKLFSSENFHAACSARVLDTKYICDESIMQTN